MIAYKVISSWLVVGAIVRATVFHNGVSLGSSRLVDGGEDLKGRPRGPGGLERHRDTLVVARVSFLLMLLWWAG